MAEVRLIDANDLLKHLKVTSITTESKKETMQYFISGIRQCLNKLVIPEIEKAPTIELENLHPTAQWKLQYNFLGDENFVCTSCGEILVLEDGTPSENDYKFCPFCGAKIVGEEKPEDADDD